MSSPDNTEQPPEFVWRVHPLRTRPKQARTGAVIILAVGAIVTVTCVLEGLAIWMTALIGLVAMAVLVLALHKFFFPSTFEIDSSGITASHFMRSQRMEWQYIRRFVHDEFGGYLSRRARRTSVDAWQGMHILFSDDRERAIQEIKSRIQFNEIHHGDHREQD